MTQKEESDHVKNPDPALISLGMSRSLTPLITLTLAVSAGLSVANLYYGQPLLEDFQNTFHTTVVKVGLIPVLTQLGYALGILFLVPLGDRLERKKLILGMIALVAVILAATAFASTINMLIALSFFIGLATVVPQVILPFAAHLAPAEVRGRVMGTVMSGLLLGILLARTVSGYIGGLWGWRVMYEIAAGLMVTLFAVLALLLPESQPEFGGSYLELLKSLWHLAKTQRILREASFIGAMLFASFSAFWATLVFHLADAPFHYGSQVAGAFGLVGAAGAAAAPLVGRLADKRNARDAVGWGLLVSIFAFGVCWIFGAHMTGLIIAVILMDLGVQAGHVANQTRVFALVPEARARLNSVYMVTYFIGGALGSYVANRAWEAAKWPGVCGVSLIFLAVGYFVFSANSRRDGTQVA